MPNIPDDVSYSRSETSGTSHFVTQSFPEDLAPSYNDRMHGHGSAIYEVNGVSRKNVQNENNLIIHFE